MIPRGKRTPTNGAGLSKLRGPPLLTIDHSTVLNDDSRHCAGPRPLRETTASQGNEYLFWNPQPQWHFGPPSAPDEFLVSSFHEYLDVFDRDSLYDANI